MSGAVPSAQQAVAALQRRDDALPDLAAMLDPARRAELLGHDAVVERVRYKPGASLVVAARDADGGRRWILSFTDRTKLDKSVSLAARVGERVEWLTPRTLSGPASADRALAPIVAKLRRTSPTLLDDASVLRYNPLRRLVLRADGLAIKLSTHARGHGDAVARRLAAAGAPVLAPARLRRGVSATGWWGGADLGGMADPGLERLAGAAIAHVHRTPLRSLPALPAVDGGRRAAEAARAIAAVLPCLDERARLLAGRLRTATRAGGGEVPLHGDWSPDQVLTDGRDVRLIDFDHTATGPPERDLGSALASGASAATFDGYHQAGGRIDPVALDAWTSLALLQRAIDPFRTAQDEWPAEVERLLRRAELALP